MAVVGSIPAVLVAIIDLALLTGIVAMAAFSASVIASIIIGFGAIFVGSYIAFALRDVVTWTGIKLQ